jgi:hypothetical protein
VHIKEFDLWLTFFFYMSPLTFLSFGFKTKNPRLETVGVIRNEKLEDMFRDPALSELVLYRTNGLLSIHSLTLNQP